MLACDAPLNPVLCLDTEFGVTLDVNGVSVAQWSDQSANSNDLFSSGAAQPAWGLVQAPSGRPAIRFDGVDDRLLRTLADSGGIMGLPDGNLGRTLFLVAQFFDASGMGGASYGTGVANQSFGLTVAGAGDGRFALQGFGSGNDLIASQQGFVAPGETSGWTVLSTVQVDDGAAPGLNNFVYQDGGEIASWDHQFATNLSDNSDLNGNSASRVVLGQDISESGAVQFDVAAMLIYDQPLSETDRLTVETYLQERFLNQQPIANPDGRLITAGETITLDILANDSDVDGSLDPTSVVIVDPPTQALSFSVDPVTGLVSYTHDGSQMVDSFTYTVNDDLGATSDVTTVSLGVHGQPLGLSSFADEVVISGGLSQPISMAFLPDGRQLILQKGGMIWITDPDSGALSPYMQLTNLNSGGERGLLDITLAPDFDPTAPGDDYFYLYYTPASPQFARIARFAHLENEGGLASRGDLNSQVLIWQDTDGYLTCCHYGGGLDFGPDGKLWLTASDKFTAVNPGEFGPDTNHAQDLTKAGGKVLRMNPDGTVPNGTDGWPANPFLDPIDDDPNLAGNQDYYDYVWAYGLRNPFRARWDFASNRFYIAEVGGNQQSLSWEDVHVATLNNAGADFGWHFCEGPGVSVYGTCSPSHEQPVFSYPHAGSGASITGGEVYHGSQFPPEWDGTYFFGDYTRDFIRYLTIDANGLVTGDFPFKPSSELPGTPNQVVFIGTGVDGALYYVLLGGTIHRIVVPGRTDRPAVISANADVTNGPQPLTVNFSSQVSDPNGDALSYTWVFGDGNSTTGAVVTGQAAASHTFATEGTYTAYLKVTDGSWTTYSGLISIQVGPNEPPVVNQLTATPSYGDPPLVVTFDATVTDVNGDLLTYEIDFGDGNTSGVQPVPVNGIISEQYTYRQIGTFNARLTVFDSLTSTQSNPVHVSVGPSSIPPITDDLVLLLESDIKVSIASGSTIAGWLDGSGWGNNLTAFGDPQYVTNATPGGMPAIAFDGNGDKLQRLAGETIGPFPTGSADRTIFAVVNYIDRQGLTAGISFGKAADNEAFGLVTDAATGQLTVAGYGAGNNFVSGAAGEGTGWLTHAAVVSANSLVHYRDGVQIDSDPHIFATNLSDPTDSKILIGEEISELGFVQIEVAAVLIYDRALDAVERQQVETYLNTKYFLGNLPPVANNDMALVARGGNVVIDVLANDSDADGVLNPATVTITTPPVSGNVSIDLVTGEVTYAHDAGQATLDSFEYTVRDEVGAITKIATVTITIGSGTLVTSGLVTSLESDAGVSMGTGSQVVGWLDSSGRGNDLQTVVGSPQLSGFATPAGQPAIVFDGDDSLARLNSIDPLNGLPASGADRSMFLVTRYNASSGYVGASYGQSGSNGAFGLVVNGSGGMLTIGDGGAATGFVSGEPGTGAGWLVQSVVLSANAWRHFRDGRLIDTDFRSFGTVLDRLVLGANLAGTQFAQMDIAAVLIYDRALNDQDRQQVEAYLYGKYLTNAAPQFTSAAAVDVPEPTTDVITLTVLDPQPETVQFSISGGADMSLFEIGGSNHAVLRFVAPPDFENPLDQGADNVYEVQVAAFDGIDTTTLDMTITVTDATVTVSLNAPATIDENDLATLAGMVTISGGTLGSLTLDLNWGDPLSPDDTQQFLLSTTPLTKATDGIDWDPVTLTFAVDHRYLDDNPSGDAINTYTIGASVMFAADIASDLTTVDVRNVAPIVLLDAPTSTPTEGTLLNVTYMLIDPGTLDTFTYDWQVTLDGTPIASGNTATIEFTPDDDGTYDVMLQVTDDDGDSGSHMLSIVVANVSPTLVLNAPTNVHEGSVFTLDVSNLFDPGNDTATLITISWGDATPMASFDPSSLPSVLQHSYDDGPVARTITASVLDEDGLQIAATLAIVVDNVNPSATVVNGGPVDEGMNGFVQVFLPQDPSNADTAAGFRYSYDFDNDGVFEITSTESDAQVVPASYLSDDPSRVIRVRIADKDGGYTDLYTTIVVNNVAPVFDAGADETTVVGTVFTRAISLVDPGSDAPWEVRIDWNGDAVVDQTIQANSRLFQISHTYGAIDVGNTYTVTVEVDDLDGGVFSDTFQVSIQNDTLRVLNFQQNPSGFTVSFNRPPLLDDLNLYDGDDAPLDLPDLAFVGQSTGAVRGSMVWDNATNTLTFVKSGGVLDDDTYTVTLISASDAFHDDQGSLLDGDLDYQDGGDFIATFTIAQNGSRVLRLPDFARGPDQPVDVTPADGTDIALPIRVSNASGIWSIDVDLVYDPNLLQIASVTKASGLPSDWAITSNMISAGVIRLTASGVTQLSGSNVAIFAVDASVPGTAPYGASQAIQLVNLSINEDNIPSVADTAIHKVTYLGDTSGNGQFSAMDAALISRVVVALDSGFDASDWTDPVLIGDTTGNGTLTGLDASFIAQKSVGLPRPEIPDDPDPQGSFVQNTGPDPTVSILSGVHKGSRGESVAVPVWIDDATGLMAADLQVVYDTVQLLLQNSNIVISNGPNEFLDGWTLVSNTIEATGTVRMALYSSLHHMGGAGTLVKLGFEVESTASVGVTPLDVEGQLNEGGLQITPVDGDFTVIGGDFNHDGLYACEDIDALVAEIVAGTHPAAFDLTGDGLVNQADRDAWLFSAAVAHGRTSAYLLGDANLDGVVDGQDFIVWNANKFTNTASWCAGDFSVDGIVDGQDFILWNANKFQSSASIMLPTPGGLAPLPAPKQPWQSSSSPFPLRVAPQKVSAPAPNLHGPADHVFAAMGGARISDPELVSAEHRREEREVNWPSPAGYRNLAFPAIAGRLEKARMRGPIADAELTDRAISGPGNSTNDDCGLAW